MLHGLLPTKGIRSPKKRVSYWMELTTIEKYLEDIQASITIYAGRDGIYHYQRDAAQVICGMEAMREDIAS